MIHIVFQEADIAALSKSFELDQTLLGDVVCIKDDYAVGPLKDIYTGEGKQLRQQWWRDVLATGDYEGKADTMEVNDTETVTQLIDNLTANIEETVWIWVAQNKHDVSGYYWLISQLKNFQGRIFILYLHNLPFINEKGHIFYPTNIFEIQPKEFLKARKLARVVTHGELEVDTYEWTKLINEDKGVRILDAGKKLIQYNHDYYDNELLKFITTDWQRVNRFLHAFFTRSKNTTGDAYLLWRLKLMIAEGKIDAQGEIKNMKDFEIKLKVPAADEV